ncbi:ABC transporter permease [Heyndrickxia acidicola]|uniref:ABC transporter permease n=1 Tax=Heyndrickxia acidicola TaxID=209389 RepID=A0ABU6ME19_9BACI|nr:ABC transporter permease [Heyndrickxia acidicola]MED1202745.1 ABC transporter permease [Heyndrickxia acidicola]
MSVETTTAGAVQPTVSSKQKKKNNGFISVLKRLVSHRLAVIGLIIVIAQALMAIFAPLLTHYDPTHQDLANALLPAGSHGHWLGTDNYGRDEWGRIVFGARISLVVGIVSVVFGLIGGITLGLLSGYYKKLDGIIMRIVDLMFAFPGILLAMLIIAILGTSLMNVIIAISIWSVPSCARIVRGSVLSVKKQEYVMAMKSLGASDARIITKHILPNCMAPIIVDATMRMSTAILSTASLSFLGLGAQPPTPEWGAMISEGQAYMWQAPHLTVIPGIAIMLVVFGFNVLGDGLRDALDPSMKINN